MVLNKRSPRATTFDFQAMSSVLGLRIFICGSNEGDNEVSDGCEELDVVLT
jgi:hypothetical protein